MIPEKRNQQLLYEFLVQGHLQERWSNWLYNLDLAHREDGTTALTGYLPDNAAVYGLFARLRDMGLVLISFRIVNQKAPNRD